LVKNVADPVKAQDVKFRQVKLDNPKLQDKLFKVFPQSALFYLQAVGFERSKDDKELLVLSTVRLVSLQAALQELDITIDALSPPAVQASSSKRPHTETSTTTPACASPLTSKQKARLLVEQAKAADARKAEAARQQTLQQIQADKHVRQHDENWTSQPSAACAKTGAQILTFRDRHGE
jgi:hypothetical protein